MAKTLNNLFQASLLMTTAVYATTALASSKNQEKQSISEITQAVSNFVDSSLNRSPGDEVNIVVSQIDPRLRLPKCKTGLKLHFPIGSEPNKLHSTVGVKCQGDSPWSIYVPVTTQVFRNVIVTTRPIPRGDKITSADIKFMKRDLSQLKRGFFVNPDEIIGKVSKMPLATNGVYTSNSLTTEKVVKRGDSILITAKAGGIQVQMKGIALAPGGEGDVIQVRNLSSKRVVEGMITSPGNVAVTM